MNPVIQLLRSSLGKKYLMALTGLVLTLFVLGHLIGNLLVFFGPDAINIYAHHLQSLPPPVLWGIRLFLLLCVIVHLVVALQLYIENRKARPETYRQKNHVQASYASRTMIISGPLLFFFILFHISHYTARIVPGMEYNDTSKFAETTIPHVDYHVHDVYSMVIHGFSVWYVSLFYIIAMALLCLHLSHGASSMFQSIGLRNVLWRNILDKVAIAYGWFLFIGYSSIPIAVLTGLLS